MIRWFRNWRTRRARAAELRAQAEGFLAEAEQCRRQSAQLLAAAKGKREAESIRLQFAGHALEERAEEFRARAGGDDEEAERRKKLADWLGLIARQYDVTPMRTDGRETRLEVVR